MLHVVTGDKKIFSWDSKSSNLDADLKPLIKYIREQQIELSFTAVLEKRISSIRTMVVIAVDQDISFFQIRPILFVLAQSKISQYAFEVKKPLDEEL
ncbi:MAG: hypothetical protein KA436_05530 [Oligoflexales bacterium]|nr:hypothetical protein [Oligoflexales bacterium]